MSVLNRATEDDLWPREARPWAPPDLASWWRFHYCCFVKEHRTYLAAQGRGTTSWKETDQKYNREETTVGYNSSIFLLVSASPLSWEGGGSSLLVFSPFSHGKACCFLSVQQHLILLYWVSGYWPPSRDVTNERSLTCHCSNVLKEYPTVRHQE